MHSSVSQALMGGIGDRGFSPCGENQLFVREDLLHRIRVGSSLVLHREGGSKVAVQIFLMGTSLFFQPDLLKQWFTGCELFFGCALKSDIESKVKEIVRKNVMCYDAEKINVIPALRDGAQFQNFHAG